MSTNDEFESEYDVLFKFVFNTVHTYIKFKPDKWIKMLSNEDFKVNDKT